MSKDFENSIEFMAGDIQAEASQMRVDALISLMSTADVVSKYIDMQVAKQPTGRTGFSVLTNLVLHGGTMAPTDISKRILRTKFAVTSLIDNLEKNGLVRREPTGKDRRRKNVSITRKGLDLIESYSLKGQNRFSNEIFRTLDDREMEELILILKKIRKHVLPLIS